VKRIIISILGVLVLVMVMLPLTQPASAVSGCTINITSDPSTGATVYIQVTSGPAGPVYPYMLVDGDDLESYNNEVPCGSCFRVWVTKPNVQYTVKNLTPPNLGWTGDDPPEAEAEGCLDNNKGINIHFTGVCDDGDPCTIDEKVGNDCVFTPKDCDDGVACTIDYCDEGTGECVNEPDDTNCDDGNVCTDDWCDPIYDCQHDFNTEPCDDGDLCTTDDICNMGACGGTPVVCPDSGYEEDGATYPGCNGSQVCTYQDWVWVDYICNPDTGECVRTPDYGETYTSEFGCYDCDDGDYCNGVETCSAGACVPGTPVTCPDSGYEEDGATYPGCNGSQVCTYQDWVWVDYICNPDTGECVRTPDYVRLRRRRLL